MFSYSLILSFLGSDAEEPIWWLFAEEKSSSINPSA